MRIVHAIEVHLVEPIKQLLSQTLAQPKYLRRVGLPLAHGNLCRLAEAYDERHRQRSGSHSAFVSTAVHLTHDAHAGLTAPHVERTDTLWSVHLVRRETREVDVHFVDVEL